MDVTALTHEYIVLHSSTCNKRKQNIMLLQFLYYFIMSETKEKAGKLKVKAKILKPKNLSNSDEPIKIDLSKL